MSQQSTSNRSCNAIFSSMPINFNKDSKYLEKKKPEELIKSVQTNKTKLNKNKSNSTETVGINKKLANQGRIKSSPSLITPDRSKPKRMDPTLSKSETKSPMKTPVTKGLTGFNLFKTPPAKKMLSDQFISHSTPECFGSVQFDTPRTRSDAVAVEDATILDGENSNLTVGVRVRPMNSKELSDTKVMTVVKVKESSITVNCDSTQHSFTYDHCFVSYTDTKRPNHANQDLVFKSMVQPLVNSAFQGYNVCLFAYGQTGSGKSYSMMGSDLTTTNPNILSEDSGIIPRFCHEIFKLAAENTQFTTNVEISYFEIYNEKIHDLLVTNSTVSNSNGNSNSKRAPLKVREHPVFGPYVVDLSQHVVQNYQDLQTWLKVGNSQRATAATGMNEKSSRSHSIFSIILTQIQKSDGINVNLTNESSRRSKINLVDLAGSERLSQTCASGDRLREGVSINKSLLILGKVIGSLAENTTNRKRGFVPYRESILTWLLKESLGGNSKTAMLATVSPSSTHLEETLATLRYACQARSIVNRVRINEDPHDKLIRELKAEVLRLRGVRQGYERQIGPRRLLNNTEIIKTDGEIKDKQREIDQLKEQLKYTEEQLLSTQRSWMEKLKETELKKKTELNFLRRCGIAIEINFQEKNSMPFLVNLSADPMLSGTLLYIIPPGTVRIGKKSNVSDPPMDILLDGPLISPLHCTLENNNGNLSLMPEINSDTYLNGQIVSEKVFLKHGDRLVIGGNHYFKICNPKEENTDNQIKSHPIDYEFAHQEILAIQEQKLKAELEEAKLKAIKELENAKREVETQWGFQKNNYEKELKLLGSTLEQQKQSLDEINKQKERLEIEKKSLIHQLQVSTAIENMTSSYESNFLDELRSILFEKTADAEIALSISSNEAALTQGGISLHEMQLLIKEAVELCREIGLNYEFEQQRIIVDKGLEPVIRIRDKDRMVETLWKPTKFLDWIHRLRDFDNDNTVKELMDDDDKESWEPFEDSDILEDSLNTNINVNSSRISINLSPIKKQLNESLHQFSMNSSFLDEADETMDSIRQKRCEDMNACLLQMELAAKTLGKLCNEHENPETSIEVTKSLDNVKNIILSIKKKLNTVHNQNACPFLKNNLLKSVKFDFKS